MPTIPPRVARIAVRCLLSLFTAGAVLAQPAPDRRLPMPGIEPPAALIPPELFSLPDDLEVTVWARSPQLRQPSNIDVDARGRVWVAEAMNYRRHAGKDPAGDRIMVLEDTDGDGQADQSHVFVQEPLLHAPLGVAVIDNQIIVSNAPDLIVYTDVDRDAKFDARVDKREVLLTGFNGRNHDHSLHSVTFGPDGKYYFNHGNTSAAFTDRSGRAFRIGSTYDPSSSGAVPLYSWQPIELAGARSDDGHVYVGGFTVRMNPDGTQAEIIGFNYRNSYEQTITSFGDVFHNDNDDPPAARTTFLMEYGNTGFFSRDGERTWRVDKRPGQPTAIAEWRQDDPGTIPVGDVYGNGAPTGIVFYEGDALGEKWRGVLLSCETARNVVFGYFPKLEGAGYALERFNFLTTNKEQVFGGIDSQRGRLMAGELKTWFRPSDIAVGPDGAIYVSDWFDPRTGGHQARDSSFAGAIYRIAPKGRRLTIPRLDLNTISGQIAALKNPAVNVRALGFNKLRAQGSAAVGPVAELLRDPNPYVRSRAVFLLAQLGAKGLAQVETQFRSEDPMLRIAAFRALRRAVTTPEARARELAPTPDQVIARARMLADDASPAVRREAALAMRDVPFAQSRDILLAVARGYDGADRSYLEAWGTGATNKEADLYAALARQAPGKDPAMWPARFANLIWRLTPAGAEDAFAARAAAPALPEPDRLAAVTALGFIPTRASAQALLELAQHGEGMVKTHALWWLINYRDIRWPDAGIDAELKARRLYDPESIAIAPMVIPEPSPTSLPPAADIARLTGNPRRGAEVAQSCLACHRIGAQGADYGPALNGFARAQTTEMVIQAIIDPSAEIAHGFDGTNVTLQDGTVVQGIALSNGDPLVVQSMGGVTQMIPAGRVKKQSQLGRSLMLSAEQLGLSAQDVADVVAYLKTQ